MVLLPTTGCNSGDTTTEPSPAAGSKPGSTSDQGGKAGAASQKSASNREAFADVEDLRIQRQWQTLDDPTQDGWSSEVFSSQAAKQLKKLGSLLESPQDLSAKTLAKIATDNVSSDTLVPAQLESTHKDDDFHVQRPRQPESADDTPVRHNGLDGLTQVMQEVAGPFKSAEGVRTKFKVYSVQTSDNDATTKQHLEISGRFGDSVLEQHATWEAHWVLPADGAPQIDQIRLIGFEQTRSQTPAGTLFTDVTSSALAHNANYDEQFLRSYNHWLDRGQNKRYLEFLSTPGIALGDVNNDGLDDLYVCQESGLPNRLFLQQPDGTANEVSQEWGVDWLEDSRSVLILDFDNDGDQDIAVAILGGVAIASNEQGQGFRLRTVLPTSDDLMSISAADYDNDGDLDIYAVALFANQRFEGQIRTASMPDSARPNVYHDANNGGRNTLLRNDIQDDNWNFADATDEVGLGMNNSRFSFMGTWDDFDNDGDQDLYVANDFGRDNLYRNDDGHFVDIGDEAGAEDAASGMSAAWGDFDRDGQMDLYVSNMWSSAGGRITYSSKFKLDASDEQKRRLQRMARGNTLLRNKGQSNFKDVSAKARVEVGRWGWGSQFADINNDGWEDILASNGYVTGDGNTGDL